MNQTICKALVLISLISAQSFAQMNPEPEMIETTSSNQSVLVLDSTINQTTGESEPTVLAVKDRKTGNVTIVGLDKDPKEAKIKALIAFRLKFPEILGLRVGANINQVVDFGLEAGYGLFFNSVGGFINVYPAGKSKKAIRNVYLGGRLQQELIFAIFAWTEGPRAELIAGYKFDKKPGGLHSFIEGGIASQIGNMNAKTAFDSTAETTSTYEPLTTPIITFGIGWTIPSKH